MDANRLPNGNIVRRATIEDTDLLRGIRLAALRDSPGAFLSRYEDFINLRNEQWRELFTNWTAAPNNAVFVATDSGVGIGMCGAFIEHNKQATLVAMWVAPAARGTAIANTLVEHACDFAHDAGADELNAWVVEDNPRAIRFYQRNAFRHHGVRQPYVNDSAKDELLIVRQL